MELRDWWRSSWDVEGMPVMGSSLALRRDIGQEGVRRRSVEISGGEEG